jgi:hypothetical protein
MSDLKSTNTLVAFLEKKIYQNLTNEQLISIIKFNNLPLPKKKKKIHYINIIFKNIDKPLKVSSDPDIDFPEEFINNDLSGVSKKPTTSMNAADIAETRIRTPSMNAADIVETSEPLELPPLIDVTNYIKNIRGVPIPIAMIKPDDLNLALKDSKNLEKINTNLKTVLKWKIEQYNKHKHIIQLEIDDIVDQINQMGLDVDNHDHRQEIRETFPMYSALSTSLSQIIQKMEKINDYTQSLDEKNSNVMLMEKFHDAINNKNKGILSLTGDARADIRNGLAGQLYSLINGPEGFINNFLNMIIMGPAGTGKTRVAGVFSYVYSRCGLLSTEKVTIVTRADLIAGFVGQTASKTRTQLLNSMEGVLFIDEAYQITPCVGDQKSSGEDFGPEAITEIVNFLDKYVGLSIIIAAGYEKEMKKCFLGSNEGMPRRFPNMFLLQKYSPEDLFMIFEKFMTSKFKRNIFTPSDRQLIYSLINELNVDNNFNNQAGDMQNLATFVGKRLISSDQPVSTKTNEPNILAGFQDFLIMKKL